MKMTTAIRRWHVDNARRQAMKKLPNRQFGDLGLNRNGFELTVRP